MVDLDDMIYEVLQDSPYPVYSGWYKEEYGDIVTVFLCSIEIPEDYSDDDYTAVSYRFQFSTFGKDKSLITEQRNYIEQMLKDNGFTKSDCNISYETDTELYHYADIYYYYLDRDFDSDEN